jgi:hypothetical protein
MRGPPIVMTWPGAVPIFPVCMLCDGKGHKVLNPGKQRLVSQDGLIICEILTGSIMLCQRCSGSGYLTRYGSRGKSFTPVVKRRRSFRFRNSLDRLIGRV